MTQSGELWSALRIQLAREPRVAWMGVLGIVLGAVCGVVGLVRGLEVPPEGNLWETATFNGAVGIFLLTLALLAPEAGFTSRGQWWWGTLLILATLYAYALETVQAFRGLDPRFSVVAGEVDKLLGSVFFFDALLLMVLFVVFAWPFFQARTTPLRLAVRYAAGTCVLSFAVGIGMSLQQGRMVGDEGNLLLVHAAGFHGLQAIPLVALFRFRGSASDAKVLRWVHVAGIAWTGLCVSLLVQAGTGLAPFKVTPALVIALGFFSVWLVVACAAGRRWANP